MADSKLRMYVETPEGGFEREVKATHYVGKYYGLYLGRDKYYFPFNGKFGHVEIRFGSGAYKPLGFNMSEMENYKKGNETLLVH